MKIFLIGYMGCGKSTLGRKIAKAVGCKFADTDSAVESREGACSGVAVSGIRSRASSSWPLSVTKVTS